MKQKIRSLFKKPELTFLIVGSFFGIVSMFAMPSLTIPDEGVHFWISYGMFSKNHQIPNDLLESPTASYTDIKNGTYIRDFYEEKDDLEGDTLQFNYSKEMTGIDATNYTGPRYVSSFDIAHLPQAIGVALGRVIYPSIGVMTLLGRFFNLVFFLVAVYFIIKKVRYGKLALAFLALFPMIIHQAASLSYDVINIVVIFAWIAFMINLFMQKTTITKKQAVVLLVLGFVLLASKQTNVLLLGVLPFLPFALYKDTKVMVNLRKITPAIKVRKRTLWIVGGAIALIGAVVFTFLLDAYLEARYVGLAQFVGVFFNTFFSTNINTQLDPVVTTGIVGHFGWLWYRLPEWLVFMHLFVFGLILLGDKVPVIKKRFAIVCASLFVLSVLIITVGMYFLWTLDPKVAGPSAQFIQGMQGRYFTPLLILLIPAFAYLQRFISVKISPKLLTIIAVSMAIFSLTVYIILTYMFFYLPS